MWTILLVEDERELARVVGRELQAHGYRVVHAADGAKALRLHATGHPDLVILDWMLPGLDGLEVLRRIRASGGEAAAVPVLMLTARSEEVDRIVGLEVGADDYLTKPFSMRELVARVRALQRRIDHVRQILEEDRRPHSTVLRYAGLCLEPDTRQVALDGAPLDLTRTEFELLHFLLRNPGRVLSRAYLLDAVWGEHYVTGDRSVDNAILRLRRKLGNLGQAIETVWGVGYRLALEEAT
ncbi:MAG: response regulator transcription factor [Anaerolineae bacterium]|jgi:DNA-binding response OmpR family regulator